MMPITPSGTRTREISRPFGRVQSRHHLADRIGKRRRPRASLRAIAADRAFVQPQPVEEGAVATLVLARPRDPRRWPR